MASDEQIVSDYLKLYRDGREDDAFHSLIEVGPQLITPLISACEDSGNIELKSFILTVIGEYRDPSGLCYLRHLLRRPEDTIWKAALDGLVKASTREALDDIEFVLDSVKDSGKRTWIDEAVADMASSLKLE